MPRIGGSENLWLNGLYESFCIIILFPVIVYLGASGAIHSKTAIRICKFLGDISYPIYITHYPLIYVYMGWVATNKLSFQEAYPIAIITIISAIILAYLSLKINLDKK